MPTCTWAGSPRWRCRPAATRSTRRALADRIGARLHLAPRFRQRVMGAPLGFGEAVWKDDPELRPRVSHVETVDPRLPMNPAGLQRLAGDFFSEQLDRERPSLADPARAAPPGPPGGGAGQGAPRDGRRHRGRGARAWCCSTSRPTPTSRRRSNGRPTPVRRACGMAVESVADGCPRAVPQHAPRGLGRAVAAPHAEGGGDDAAGRALAGRGRAPPRAALVPERRPSARAAWW